MVRIYMADFKLIVGADVQLSYAEMQKDISELVKMLNSAPQKIKFGLDIGGSAASSATSMADLASKTREVTSAVTSKTAATKTDSSEELKRQSLLKKSYTLLTQMQNAETKWTAAKAGKSSSSYAAIQGDIADLQRWSAQFKDGTITAGEFSKRLSALSSNFVTNSNVIKAAGEATQTWDERLGSLTAKFGTWFSITRVIMAAYRAVREMVTNVVELDTAMTELKKVTDETDVVYEKFLVRATSRAKELGAALTDTVNATADFARLGYSIKDAEKLADAAIVYKNVGDGIDDIGTASESIIATMQAFQIAPEDIMSIVDRFNEVGNNFAISSKGVGDVLLRSAAALHSANNTIDESIGLAAAANTVIQDPEKVGTVLKTVSMYLRAAKTDAESAGESTEGMANSVSELRDEILSLTGNKVDIQIDENTFKSTYQILRELSQIWPELSDISQANILELVGGKRNSNVIAALLENFSVAEKALQSSSSSAGSALEENEKVLDSIKGKIEIFKAAFEDLSNTIISSDLVKFVVDAGSKILDVLNSIIKVAKTLPTLTGAFAAFRSFHSGKGFLKTDDISRLFSTNASKTVQPFANAEQVIWKYNQAIQHNSLTQQGWMRLLAQSDDGLRAYLTSIKGTTATYSAYNETLNNNFRGLKNVSSAISKYNSLAADGADKQLALANAVAANNGGFGAYLAGLKGGSASLGGYISYLVKTKLATIGLQIATAALNAAITMGVSFAIQMLITSLSNLARQVENTREAAEGFSNSISNFNKNLKDNGDTLSTLNNRYKELSQGVGKFGQNLRLTSDDYEEYKDIISQVSDIMPDLAVRYNEQGEKIGFVKNQIEDLTDAYHEWQRTQARKFIFEGDESGNTFQDVIDNYNQQTVGNEFAGLKEKTSFGQAFANGMKEVVTLGFSDTFETTFNAETKKKIYEEFRDFEGSRYDLYNKMMDFKSRASIDNKEFKELFGYLPDDINNMTDEEFENWRNSLNGHISKYQSEIDYANQKIIEGMKMVATSSEEYWAANVSENERGSISNFLSNMTNDMIKTLAGEDGNLSQGEINNFVTKLTKAFADSGDTLDAFDSLMAEEFNNMSYAESTEAIDEWISNLASSTGFDKSQLKEMFGVDKDVMEPLSQIVVDAGTNDSSKWYTSFGRLRNTHIEEITSMLTSSGATVQEQAQALDILGQSLDSFDRATGGELTRILEDLDSTDPESVKKYNEEIQNFFDTIKNNDQFGEEFASVIGVLEDTLGNASVAFENFEAKYSNFLSLAEKGDTSTGETAISKAIEVLKTGLNEGNVSSNLFNEALNLVFGDKRPSDLADALAEIELLFGSGENSATKLYNKLDQYTENGVVNFKKMREELNLSDATFVAFKEKLRDMGVFLANSQDMNLIGDGLGISNDKILQFEASAQSLVKQFKDGTISAEDYNKKVEDLANNYNLASDAAIDFKRNMNFAATGKYRIADDEFGGNITSFLGIGGNVALEIESFIAKAHDDFTNAEITPDSILDIDPLKEDIRQKLREAGEYTEAEIESLVSEIEKRIKSSRVETALSKEFEGLELTIGNLKLNDQGKEPIKQAIMDSYDVASGTIDLGKLEAKISGLELVKSGAISKDDLMGKLGFEKDGDSWSLDKSTGIGKIAIGLSTETATQNLQGVIDQADKIQSLLDKLDKCTTIIKVKHDDLANAEGQALSTKYTLQDMQKRGYTIPVTFTYKGKPKGFETEDTTPDDESGPAMASGNAFVNGNAFNNGRIGAKKTENALFGELGQEIIVDAKNGTWRTVGDNGAEFNHINKGDIVFNAEQTKALLKNGRTNSRGKSYASGTAYITRVPETSHDQNKNIITTTSTTSTTSSTTSSLDSSYYSTLNAWLEEHKKSIEKFEKERNALNRQFENSLDAGNKEQVEILRVKLAENAKNQKDALQEQNEIHRVTMDNLLQDLYLYAPSLKGKSWEEISEVDLSSIEIELSKAAEAASEDSKDQADKNLNYFQGIVDDIKSLQDTMEDNSESWWEIDNDSKQYWESQIDFQEDYSREWIENQKAFGKMTDKEELDAYDRMINNNKEFQKQILNDTSLSEESKLALIKETNDKIIDIEKDAYNKRKDIFDEATDFSSTYLDSQKTLLQSHYDVTNSIAEARHEINKELETSMTMYGYLDKETRQLLFNQEDYNKLSKELNEIEDEALRLQTEYEDKLRNSTLETIESITSEYEMQYETLMKSYEIAKADLEIAKKKAKLNNVLNERNVRMLINGQWQWVANTEDVVNAKAELADAEYAKQVEQAGLTQQQSINNLTKQQDQLGVVVKKFENGVIDLATAVKLAKEAIGSMPNAVKSMFTKTNGSSSSSAPSYSKSSFYDAKADAYRGNDYMADIDTAIANDDMDAAIEANHNRNDKIDYLGLGDSNKLSDDKIKEMFSAASKNAKGTKSAIPGLSVVNEEGMELLRTNHGDLIPLEGGETIFSKYRTDNLWAWSGLNPNDIMSTIDLSKLIINSGRGGSITNYNLYGDVHNDTVNNLDDFINDFSDRFRTHK